MKLFVCAVEPSGDALGAALADAMRKKCGDVDLIGCGGPLLKNAGLASLIDISPFSVMGPASAIKAWPAALSATDALAKAAAAERPDAAIFIDSWSFSKMAAAKMKKTAPGVKRIKYVAPQVWASRPRRAEELPRYFDGLLCLFDFEAPYFEKGGAGVRVVGHSGFHEALQQQGDGARFRNQYKIGETPLLAVLPGSRQSELDHHIKPFADVVRRLVQRTPALQIVIAAAPAIADQLPALTADWPAPVRIVQHTERYDAFAAADAALAVSGTVTTELAIHGTPMVVCYRLTPLSAAFVRLAVTAPYASLINIAAGEMVIPEFVRQRIDAGEVADALHPLLTQGPVREAQCKAFPALIRKLAGEGGAGPADRAAEAIIDWSARENAKNG